MTDHADFFSMLGQAARDVRSLAPEALDDRRRALLDAGKPRPPAKGIMDWRAVVDAAIKQGDVAEEKISERDREALLCLGIEPRREAMGNPEDPRVKNLSRADADLVRESLGGPGKKPKRAKIDPIKAAAERRARERETLRDFQAAFRDRIAVARQTLEAALRRSHRQPEAVATAVLQALLVTPPPILLHRLCTGAYGRFKPLMFLRQAAWGDTYDCVTRLTRIAEQYQAVSAELAAIKEPENEDKIPE